MYSLNDVSAKLGVPYYRIVYAHNVGKLPEPPRWKGRRIYDDEDIRRASEYFRSKADTSQRSNGSEDGDY